ncbi:MAG: hypothetical protein QXE01_05545 [Sulfolobales archaeon]
MNKDAIRKAIAGVLAFIIGISIAIVTIIPLLIYLNNTSGAMIRALNQVRDFEAQRGSEDLEVVYESGSIYLKNIGSIPATIVLAVIDSGNGCNLNTLLLKTNISINTSDRIRSINTTANSYGLDRICYVMTARGNVFPVRERYNAIQSQLSLNPNTTGIISPDNTIFAQDMGAWNQAGKINVTYGSSSCSSKGNPYIGNIPPYDKQLLSVKDNNSNLIQFSLNNKNQGYICFKFRDVLNLTQQGYAVLALFRIVVVGVNMNSNNFRLDISVNGSVSSGSNSYGSSSTFLSWQPKSNSDYLVWDVIMLIPLKQGSSQAPPGVYSLEIDIILDQNTGNGSYYVGIEYLSIQGMKLIV